MKFLKSILIIPLIFLMAGCKPAITNDHSKGSMIVCLGASLTLGIGADPGHDYPSLLRTMVHLPVINAGINSDTTRDELKRLQKDVLSFDPKMVIITQRYNDFRHNISKEESLKNLEVIIDQIQGYGAMVVLVTFEPKEFQESYFKDFRQLAVRKHAILVADVLQGIDKNPQYMQDEIHPNNEGYKIVAEKIYQQIKSFL